MSYDITNYNLKFYENPVIVDQRINNSGLFNSGVRAIASSIYELYFNTRKASENNNDFYDKKRNDYYIIYKNDEIMARKHFTSGMINKAKHLLKDIGLIKTIPQKWNQPDRIYLLDFDKIYKSLFTNNFSLSNKKTSGHSQVESHKNNTSKTIHKNNYINTYNTRKSKLNQKQSTKINHNDLKAMIKQTIIKTNLTRIPEQIADISFNDTKFYHHILRLFFNAKISVRRDIKNAVGESSKVYKQAKTALRFEKNLVFYNSSSVAKNVYWIVRKAYKTAFNYHNQYIMKSFKQLFKDAVHNYKINHTNVNGPEIPIFKI